MIYPNTGFGIRGPELGSRLWQLILGKSYKLHVNLYFLLKMREHKFLYAAAKEGTKLAG